MSRKGNLLATASGDAAASSAISGAQAQPPAPPAPIWAGWYVGVNAGVNWQRGDGESFGGYSVPSGTHTSTGFVGGGQLGYNWQSGNIVFGIVADIDGLTGKGTSGRFRSEESPKGYFSNQITWLTTVRGKLGLVADNTFVYGTGGLAVGGVKNSYNMPNPTGSKSVSTTKTGWALGVGAERMLWNSHWSVGLEALFVDLGHTSATKFGKTSNFSNQAALLRVLLNYKF